MPFPVTSFFASPVVQAVQHAGRPTAGTSGGRQPPFSKSTHLDKQQ